ncbi:MAG TPA: hypothetical protein VME66_00295 [Candidatus Acidoferrales bacterium]|nr:hypothetical protein [Candidatus Acidoferrales bacterium]
MSTRAAVAIARRRLSLATRIEIAQICAIGAAFGLFFPTTDMLATATLVSIAGATSSRFLRKEFRNPTVFAAPLYGRELARAEAIVPLLRTLAFTLALTTATTLRGHAPSPTAILVLILSGTVAALTALSGALRESWSEYLYMLLAISAGIVTALASGIGGYGTVLIPTAIAATIGYISLRAFAETLARYDPI